jgi:hypothetical protein
MYVCMYVWMYVCMCVCVCVCVCVCDLSKTGASRPHAYTPTRTWLSGRQQTTE